MEGIIKFVRQNSDFKLFLNSVLIILLWFLFEDKILNFINITFLKLFVNLNISISIEVALIIGFILLLAYQILKMLNAFIENKPKLLLLIVIGIIYTNYRFLSNKYEFNSFSFCKEIKYFDILFYLMLTSIVLILINYLKLSFVKILKKENKIKRDTLKNDDPWKFGDEDLLSRLYTSKEISKEILSKDITNSYSLGIVGGWGDGKTSLLNMIKVELKKEKNLIIIDFNPWRDGNFKSINKSFFNSLKDALIPFSSEIFPSINKYLEILISHDKSKLTNYFSNIFQEQYESQKQYEKVNDSIKRINKKIIIFIDDFDRLDSSEIVEVLKLIRNTGKFSNTLFIAAYDRNYINEALKKFTIYKNDLFIEKIIQHEILLPNFPQNIISDMLILNIKKYFKGDVRIINDIENSLVFKPEDYGNLLKWDSKLTPHFSFFITNIRDVKRFYYSFIQSYKTLREDVSFIDFFHLELIKLKNYNIYNSIKKKVLLKQSKEHFFAYSIDNEKFDKLYNDLNEYEKSIFKEILDVLFPIKPDDKIYPKICSQKYFQIYFYDQIFYRLSRTDFIRLFELNENEIEKKINDWLDKQYYNDIHEYLTSIKFNYFISINEFNNYIFINFYLAELYNEFNLFDFIIQFTDENIKKISTEYGFENNVFVDRIKEKFQNYRVPFSISKTVRLLILDYLRDKIHLSFFNIEELQKLALNYLKKYLKNSTDLDEDGIWLYYSCIEKVDKDSNRKIYLMPSASILMREFIEEHPNYYILSFFRKDPYYHDENFYTIEPFATSIFGSYDNLSAFIDNLKDRRFDTVKERFIRFKDNNYKSIKIDDFEETL